MFRRGVTLMLRQAVLRINRIPFDHQAIALDLCDDRRRRDRNRKRVAVNQRFLLDQHIQLHRIQKQVIRRNCQLARASVIAWRLA